MQAKTLFGKPTLELPKTLAISCSCNKVDTQEGAQNTVDVPTLKCVLLKRIPFKVSLTPQVFT